MKTVLITGGATGLGKELAKLYAQNDYQVILVGRNLDSLKQTKEELGAKIVHAVSIDIQNYEEVTKKMQELLTVYSVDILINNAGVGHFGPLSDYSKKMIDDVIDTNVKGTIYMTQACISHLQTRPQGKIINIISTAGLRGKKNESIYVASKFAMRGFTESLKVEYQETNLSIIAAYMGGMDTPFWSQNNHIKDKSRLTPPLHIAQVIYDKQNEKEDIIL
ncbi:SDR family oxidoreductase [Priestia megaterium]|nr:SDR family oxidoreductase [Priestia megaterium]